MRRPSLRPLSIAMVAVVVIAVATAAGLAAGAGARPTAPAAATCADYTNQAEAQRAADTRDTDGDGVYCESLPCPCLKPGSNTDPSPAPTLPRRSCTRPRAVQLLVFSRPRYPNIRRHTIRAIHRGWPRVMVLNRPGAAARRERLLEAIPTKHGFDRDEYPAAVGRGRPNGRSRALIRGNHPRGWKADVMYVPSAENRSHGSSLGAKLRRFCNGTRFRYAFR
jgi:hypothetical protein